MQSDSQSSGDKPAASGAGAAVLDLPASMPLLSVYPWWSDICRKETELQLSVIACQSRRVLPYLFPVTYIMCDLFDPSRKQNALETTWTLLKQLEKVHPVAFPYDQDAKLQREVIYSLNELQRYKLSRQMQHRLAGLQRNDHYEGDALKKYHHYLRGGIYLELHTCDPYQFVGDESHPISRIAQHLAPSVAVFAPKIIKEVAPPKWNDKLEKKIEELKGRWSKWKTEVKPDGKPEAKPKSTVMQQLIKLGQWAYPKRWHIYAALNVVLLTRKTYTHLQENRSEKGPQPGQNLMKPAHLFED